MAFLITVSPALWEVWTGGPQGLLATGLAAVSVRDLVTKKLTYSTKQ